MSQTDSAIVNASNQVSEQFSEQRKRFKQNVDSVEKMHSNGIRICCESYEKLEQSLNTLNDTRKNLDLPLVEMPNFPECKLLENLVDAIQSLRTKVESVAQETKLAQETALENFKKFVAKVKKDIDRVNETISQELATRKSKDVLHQNIESSTSQTTLSTLSTLSTQSTLSDSKSKDDKPREPLYDAFVFDQSTFWAHLTSESTSIPKGMVVDTELHYIVNFYGRGKKVDELPQFPDGASCCVNIVGYVEDNDARVFMVNNTEEYKKTGTKNCSFITFAHVKGLHMFYGQELIKNVNLPFRKVVNFEKPVKISGRTRRVFQNEI